MTSRNPRAIDVGLLILRVLIGFGIAYLHGKGKVTGGVEGMAENIAGWGLPVPLLWAWLAALTEFLGGIFIALGFLTRPAAVALLIMMLTAVAKSHGDDVLGAGEKALLYGVPAMSLIFAGAGNFSIDAMINKAITKK